jgi:hypothetical protein
VRRNCQPEPGAVADVQWAQLSAFTEGRSLRREALRRMLWEMESAEAAAHSREDEEHSVDGHMWIEEPRRQTATVRLLGARTILLPAGGVGRWRRADG